MAVSMSVGVMPNRAAACAVDRQVDRAAVGLLVGADVLQLRQGCAARASSLGAQVLSSSRSESDRVY